MLWQLLVIKTNYITKTNLIENILWRSQENLTRSLQCILILFIQVHIVHVNNK